MFVDLNACRRRLAALDAVQANIEQDRSAVLALASRIDLQSIPPHVRLMLADHLRTFDMAIAECRSERHAVSQLMDLDEGEDSIHLVSQVVTIFIG